MNALQTVETMLDASCCLPSEQPGISLEDAQQRALGQPTVSHHLKILVEAGLLNREKRGTWAYYSLVPGALDRVTGLLASL